MGKWVRWMKVGLGVVVVVGAVRVGWGEGAGARPKGDVLELVKRLGSEDFGAREGAQKELEAMPGEMEEVRRLSGVEKDPEVRARLAVIGEKLEMYRLVHPAGVTVDLKGATFGEVVEALNKAMGGVYVGGMARGMEGATFTLEAENKPFWEVVEALARQREFRLSAGSGRMVMADGRGVMGKVYYQGMEGFMVTSRVTLASKGIGSTVLMRVGRGEMGPAERAQVYEVDVYYVNDPRMEMRAKSLQMELVEVKDNEGRDLSGGIVKVKGGEIDTDVGGPRTGGTVLGLFKMPEKHGTMFSIKGAVRFALPLKDRVVVLEGFEKEPVQHVMTVYGEVTMEKRMTAGGEMELVMEMKRSVDAPKLGLAMAQVVGEDGSRGLEIGLSGSKVTGLKAGAFKVEVKWARGSLEVKVPVELKDVPIADGFGAPRGGGG